MSKLVEVKMPPLDGTEFVVVWVSSDSGVWTGLYCVIDNVILEFSKDEWDFVSKDETYPWENDLGARYFVVED